MEGKIREELKGKRIHKGEKLIITGYSKGRGSSEKYAAQRGQTGRVRGDSLERVRKRKSL
jgi:hypothetical protein